MQALRGLAKSTGLLPTLIGAQRSAAGLSLIIASYWIRGRGFGADPRWIPVAAKKQTIQVVTTDYTIPCARFNISLDWCASLGDISMKMIQAVPGSDEYQAKINEIQDHLRDYQENPRLVRSPEALDKLEQEIRGLTEALATLVIGQQIQHSLDSEEMQEAQSQLVKEWPHRLENHEREGVWVRTATGAEIWVKVTYFTRKRKRFGKKRYPGFYLGLLLLGIHDRCTSGFAAEVSLLAAMLGSLAEARNVLVERGITIDIKVLRRIAVTSHYPQVAA